MNGQPHTPLYGSQIAFNSYSSTLPYYCDQGPLQNSMLLAPPSAGHQVNTKHEGSSELLQARILALSMWLP